MRTASPAPGPALLGASLVGAALAFGRESAAMMAGMAPLAKGRIAWLELANKLEAFDLYQNGPSRLAVRPGPGSDLARRVRAAREMSRWQAPWVIEGIGLGYGERVLCRAGGRPAGALAREETGELAADCRLALHTGLGLALAGAALRLDPEEPDLPLSAAVDRFAALARGNSLPGYEGAVLEALGLVARTLYPNRLDEIDDHLAAVDPELRDLLWHGAGRGLYFAPTNALPCTSVPWRAVRVARREPPYPGGRDSALAGFTWALALVNLRHPQVLEALLRHHPDLAADPAAAAGVAAAAAVWRDLSPSDPLLAGLAGHRPAAGLAAPWRRLVGEPCARALAGDLPAQRAGRPGDLFRLQPREG